VGCGKIHYYILIFLFGWAWHIIFEINDILIGVLHFFSFLFCSQWLIPNHDGTKGCPKYVKEHVDAGEGEGEGGESQPEQKLQQQQQQQQKKKPVAATTAATKSNSNNRRDRSDSKELSASAPAFVAK
jgi:hypothetical protein